MSKYKKRKCYTCKSMGLCTIVLGKNVCVECEQKLNKAFEEDGKEQKNKGSKGLSNKTLIKEKEMTKGQFVKKLNALKKKRNTASKKVVKEAGKAKPAKGKLRTLKADLNKVKKEIAKLKKERVKEVKAENKKKKK